MVKPDVSRSTVSQRTCLQLASCIHFCDMWSNLKRREKTLLTRSSGTLVSLRTCLQLDSCIHFCDMWGNLKRREKTLLTRSSGTLAKLTLDAVGCLIPHFYSQPRAYPLSDIVHTRWVICEVQIQRVRIRGIKIRKEERTPPFYYIELSQKNLEKHLTIYIFYDIILISINKNRGLLC